MSRQKEIINSNHSWSNWVAVLSLDERVKSLTKYMNESSNLLNELIHEVNLPESKKMRLIEINSKNREVIKYMVPPK